MSRLAISAAFVVAFSLSGFAAAQEKATGQGPSPSATAGDLQGDGASKAEGPHKGKRMTRAERQAQRAELVEKRNAGTLSADENATLERLERLKAHHDKLRETRESRRATRKERADKHRQTLVSEIPNPRRPEVREAFHTHARRMARLTRAREVAEAEERADLVERIDGLIAKEQARHGTVVAELKNGGAP